MVFFFQAEDGIRDGRVTGVQTCALPISAFHFFGPAERPAKITGVHASFPVFIRVAYVWLVIATVLGICAAYLDHANGWVRSEERRVGKECRCRWSPHD